MDGWDETDITKKGWGGRNEGKDTPNEKENE
jgi:hypothetical protein